MKKLLSLLKKDAILVRRNKIWTALELLAPLFLLVIPVFFIPEQLLMGYKHQQESNKALRSFTGTVMDVDLPDKAPEIELHSGNCKTPPEITVTLYSKYPKNYTRPDRTKYIGRVKAAAKICKPIGGVFTTPEGVDMIVPATYSNIGNLKLKVDKPSTYSGSIFDDYAPIMYKATNKKFYAESAASNYTPGKDLDKLRKVFIFDDQEMDSIFPQLAMFIGLCVTLPVISTTRTMVVEKDSVQPYLHSIGLSRTLFYAEHFIFSTLKGTLLISVGTVLHCIFFPHYNAFWLLVGVIVYIAAAISFAMLVSTLFTKPRRGVEGILLFWGVLSFLPLIIDVPEDWRTIPASLNINYALKFYFLAIEPHFAKDDGMSFMDGFSSGREGYYSCVVYLGIMLFDGLLMGFGSVFVSRFVDKTSKCVVNAFWKQMKRTESPPKTHSSSEIDFDGILLGEENVEGRKDATSDIQVDNLVKIYSNGETAVNGLSLRAVRGQVSVLLGHNGCGKSTTFGMITGIHEPTSGSIFIEGVDAVSNRKEARQSIGYCPQYNPLYERLTVKEHLKLVNTLKGADPANFEEDAENLMHEIELSDKRDELAKNLSGGMKRKLCVCMAMIGGSRVVLLDEPTAGMDPGARLDVQKMLDKVKSERTILLTTHYMDEAEKLGDWVFVMSHGKMAASGSLHYLKKKYGDGYLMTLVLDPQENAEEVVPILQQVCSNYVGNSVMKDQRGQMVEFSLPDASKQQFLLLFQALETIIAKQFASDKLESLPAEVLQQVKNLKIVAMGLSVSSLEQVFIKIEKECDRVLTGADDAERRATAERNFEALVKAKLEPQREGFSLYLLQLRTFLYKRWIHLRRNPDQTIMQIFVPLLAIYFITTRLFVRRFDSSIVSMNYNLSLLPTSKAILQFEGSVDSRIEDYLSQFKQLEISHAPITMNVSSLVKNQTMKAKKIGLVVSFFLNRTVLYYHESTPNALAVALNLLSNLKFLRINSNHSVGTFGLHADFIPIEGNLEIGFHSFKYGFLLNGLVMMISCSVLPAIAFLIEERVSKFQHQQLLTGVSPFVFWSSSILFDFIIYASLCTYVITFSIINEVLTDYIYLIIATMICYFFAYEALIYFLSVFIRSPAVGSTVLGFHRSVFFAAGAISFLIVVMKPLSDQLATVRKLYFLGLLDPGLIYMFALLKIYFSQSGSWKNFASARKFMFRFESIFQFQAIWIDLIFLILFSVLFFWFFVAFRSKIARRIVTGCGNAKPRPKKRYAFLEGFSSTNGETTTMVTSSLDSSQAGSSVVVVEKLVKDFRRIRAVNGLSMSVKQRECFGLLGQNGAGKTTTFDMLTGLTLPSGGSATVSGENITNKPQIGYCPQFDAMMGQYSGRQCLRIMTRLQGYENSDEVVEMVLNCIGMTEHAEKLIKHCSGGQKRKLSVGIALISRSQCVMLDEPTAGIDPRARREIWDILHCMREKANCSIVLTSHSMEECEALCTRIGVLRGGEMIALGTSQELKSKFGSFYLMTLVLSTLESSEGVKAAVIQKWKDAILKTEPTRASLQMVYQLPKHSDDKWSETFMQVDELAAQLEIEDYMLTQATLEDAFLRLNANE
ncbi:unnamed protein product [Caenorhabditis sp. 36 PRJEB53466]|nr:unnamed protein product [Caenorhabditis sp. 36 PRJEB53466]